MTRKTKIKRIRLAVTILIIIEFIYILYFCYQIYSINKLINQYEQEIRYVTTATVINVNEYREGYKNQRKCYDIIYQYEVKNNVYTNTFYRRDSAKKAGDTFKIKYNSDNPNESEKYRYPNI